MNHFPILSIVIPTFNRSELLKITLNQLIFNTHKLENFNNIEIIISDNHSTDNTQEIVKKIIISNPALLIKYNRNSSNLGFDKNCIVGASLCTGNFIWFISDDDIIKQDAFDQILTSIKNNFQVKFIFLNYTVKTPGWEEAPPLYLAKDLIVDCNDLILNTKLNFSCITSCIFESNAYRDVDTTLYVGTFWIHMYIVREIACLGSSLIISKPIFTFNRPNLIDSRKGANKIKTTEREFYIDAHINVIKYTSTFNEKYNDYTKRKAAKIVWNDNLNQILSYKLTIQEYNFREIKSIFIDMKIFYKYKINFWLIHVPVLFANSLLAKIIFYFKLKFARTKQILKPYIPKTIFIYYKRWL